MSKKEIKFVPPVEEPKKVEEPLFESEAYGSPQPDAGMETTVTKPIGIGGPVPIVAPKHNTIQLQPIIVPLAVVPYMTQDSDVLRTDGQPTSQRYAAADGEATEFQSASKTEKVKVKKQRKAASRTRIAALLSLVFSGLIVAAFLLAKFLPDVGMMHLGGFNVIDQIIAWVNKTVPSDMVTTILIAVSAGMAAIVFILSLIGVIFGKSPKAFVSVLTLLYSAPYVVILGIKLVKKTFVAANDVALLVLLGVSVLAFIVSVIAAVIGDGKEKDADPRKVNFDTGSEI